MFFLTAEGLQKQDAATCWGPGVEELLKTNWVCLVFKKIVPLQKPAGFCIFVKGFNYTACVLCLLFWNLKENVSWI